MILKHITIGQDEVLQVEEKWRISKVAIMNGELHVLLQADDVEEWKGVRESLRKH